MIPTRTPLTACLVVSLSLLGACAQMPEPAAVAAHDAGWREGVIEQVATAQRMVLRRGVDCRQDSPPANDATLYARVSYTFQKVRLERIVPLSDTSASLRAGQPVRFQVTNCRTPAQPL